MYHELLSGLYGEDEEVTIQQTIDKIDGAGITRTEVGQEQRIRKSNSGSRWTGVGQ